MYVVKNYESVHICSLILNRLVERVILVVERNYNKSSGLYRVSFRKIAELLLKLFSTA